jgi:GAF domain-containing protein
MTISQSPAEHQTQSLRERIFLLWNRLTAPHPSVQDVGEKRRAQLLAILSLVLAGAFIIAVFTPTPTEVANAFIAFLGITAVCYALSRTKYYRLGTYIFTYGLTSITYLRLYTGTANGVEAAITSTGLISLVLASALLSQRGFFSLVVISTIATFATPLYSQVPLAANESVSRTGGAVLSIGAILLSVNALRAGIERARLKNLQDVNRELEMVRGGLEQRVEERTTELALANQETEKRSSELQAITEISQTIALVQNIDDQLPLITGLISERFGFYHVGIFLLDEGRENAVLQAANSKGGQRMLARKHKLKLGSTSIVGFASQTGRARVALDIGADISYFDNPDLPDTHSEVALPLKIGERVIGVLDVQSTEVSAFKEDKLGILTTLANQVAVAIQNASLYRETQTALSEARRTLSKKLAFTSQAFTGFTYAADGTIQPAPAIPVDKTNNSASDQTIILDAASGASTPTLHVPVKLRDQIVGFLNIESTDPDRNWSENEIALVQTISERAAFALENARLFESVARRADQEETVARITSNISASTDFNHILQTTIQELSHSLNANRAYIQFGTTSRDADEKNSQKTPSE